VGHKTQVMGLGICKNTGYGADVCKNTGYGARCMQKHRLWG
jgi:hypothetical protein